MFYVYVILLQFEFIIMKNCMLIFKKKIKKNFNQKNKKWLKNIQKSRRKHFSRSLVFIKNTGWKISQNFQESTCARASFLIKIQVSGWRRLFFMSKICLLEIPQISNDFNKNSSFNSIHFKRNLLFFSFYLPCQRKKRALPVTA